MRILVTLLLVLTIIAVWTLVIVIGVRLFGSGKPSESGETTPVSVLETTPAPPVTSAPPVDVQTEIIRLPKADLAKGDLILVSTLLQRAYSFPEGGRWSDRALRQQERKLSDLLDGAAAEKNGG